MKPIRLFCLFIALLGAGVLSAQQDIQLTQFNANRTFYNPAAVGSRQALCISGAYRYQWLGYEDEENVKVTPQSMVFMAEMPVYKIHSGIGLSVAVDKAGFEKNMDIRLNYAYQLKIKKTHTLAVGLSAGILNKTIDFSQFTPEDDPLVTGSDDSESALAPDLGLGVFYQIPGKFFAGISMAHLLQPEMEIGNASYSIASHYYLMAGYDISLINNRDTRLVLTPSVLLKTSTVSTQLDANLIVTYNDRVWGGLLYRMQDAVGIMAGVKLFDFSIGLSYDYTLSSLSEAGSKGSPEVFLRYCMPMVQKIKFRSQYNTRFM